jgi:ribose transport system permease protein
VLTSGIDLSVGHGDGARQLPGLEHRRRFAPDGCMGVIGVLLTGCLCGAINGLIVIYGRLQPIVTTIATGGGVLRDRAGA